MVTVRLILRVVCLCVCVCAFDVNMSWVNAQTHRVGLITTHDGYSVLDDGPDRPTQSETSPELVGCLTENFPLFAVLNSGRFYPRSAIHAADELLSLLS